MLERIKNFFRKKEKKIDMNLREEVLYILRNYLENKEMYLADEYYKGNQKILNKKREMFDNKTKTKKELLFLPCNKIVDNKFQVIIDQKTNYLVSKRPVIVSNDEEYNKELNKIFNEEFFFELYQLVKNIYLYGIAWLYVNYNEKGELNFNLIDSKEIIPVWEDARHEKLRFAIRKYVKNEFLNGRYEEKTYIEVYSKNGIEKYRYERNDLVYLDKYSYIKIGENQYNWDKIPLIAFKNKHIELPLIRNIKQMQDSLNSILSTYIDRIEQDEVSSIIILKGYQGQDLADFRQKLLETGAVNVGEKGDVDKLNIEINSTVFESGIKAIKTGLYECSNTFDSKNDMLGHDPNSMNILSMYSAIDLDANETEREMKKRFKTIIWFVNRYLENKGLKNYDDEEVSVIFDRDILINESQVIDNLLKSQGILSKEKLIEEHPLVQNPKKELERLNKELESMEIINDGYFNHLEPKEKGAENGQGQTDKG